MQRGATYLKTGGKEHLQVHLTTEESSMNALMEYGGIVGERRVPERRMKGDLGQCYARMIKWGVLGGIRSQRVGFYVLVRD